MSEAEKSVLRGNLPYVGEGREPADMMDVLNEMRTWVALIAGVVATAPSIATQLIEDAKKEPGQTIMMQQARLGLAMESWLGQSNKEVVECIGEALPNMIGEAVVAANKALIEHQSREL